VQIRGEILFFFKLQRLGVDAISPDNSGMTELRTPQEMVEFVHDRRITGESCLTYRIDICTNLTEAIWTEEGVPEVAIDPINSDFQRIHLPDQHRRGPGKFIRLIIK
jgi:hypothetical protein